MAEKVEVQDGVAMISLPRFETWLRGQTWRNFSPRSWSSCPVGTYGREVLGQSLPVFGHSLPSWVSMFTNAVDSRTPTGKCVTQAAAIEALNCVKSML